MDPRLTVREGAIAGASHRPPLTSTDRIIDARTHHISASGYVLQSSAWATPRSVSAPGCGPGADTFVPLLFGKSGRVEAAFRTVPRLGQDAWAGADAESGAGCDPHRVLLTR
ncbi:hypothetical protein GCM10023096_12220 [Nonomuraea ferruginea]